MGRAAPGGDSVTVPPQVGDHLSVLPEPPSRDSVVERERMIARMRKAAR